MTKRQIVLLSLAGFGLLVLGGAGLIAIRVLAFVHEVAPSVGLGDVMRMVRHDPDAMALDRLGRVNFLLLGYGGSGHTAPYLTDSMMVVSAQAATRQLAMVSIPRDLQVPIPTNRMGLNWTTKINTAYMIGVRDDLFPLKAPVYRGPLGGGNLSAEMVHRVTGLPIPYWVAVDFDGFKRAVDAVGGVDIDVPRALDDRQYPRGNGYMHVHFNAGLQHMNGERALEFARLRHTQGGDFDRSRRQQLVLLAVRQKALTLGGLPHLLGLLDALSGHFRTNMSLSQIEIFAGVMEELKVDRAARVSVDDTNFLADSHTADGQFILVPLESSYAALRRYLDHLFPQPAVYDESASVQLIDGTASGRNLTGLYRQLLSWVGITSSTQATGPSIAQSEVRDYSGGRAALTVSYLASLFQARVIKEATPSAEGGASVVLVLGRDVGRSFPPPPRAPLPAKRPSPRPTLRPSASPQPTPSSSPAG